MFRNMTNSDHDHYRIRVAASSNQVVAVGARYGEPKTELLSIGQNKWSGAEDYPFADSIFMAPILHINATFIMFGGCTYEGHPQERIYQS